MEDQLTKREAAFVSLVQSQIWCYIEEGFVEKIDSIRNLDEVDVEKDSEELKTELKARRIAAEKMRSFLNEIKAFAKANETDPKAHAMQLRRNIQR